MTASQFRRAFLITFIAFVAMLSTPAIAEQKYPDVVDVRVSATGNSYRFDVTLSSPYDSRERYADAFRIKTVDGNTLGIRQLLHDHAYEQPFTRSLTGVEIPADISEVIVEGRDQKYGWGGKTMKVSVPGR